MSKRGREAKGSASILPLILLRKEKAAIRPPFSVRV